MKHFDLRRISALRILATMFLVFFLNIKTFAQQQNPPLSIYWDTHVGCLDYDEDIRKHVTIEDIQDGDCIKVCENSQVTYFADGQNIVQVTWQPIGGNLISTANHNATIQWGNYGNAAINITIELSNGTIIEKTLCIEKKIAPKAIFEIAGPGDNVFCQNVDLSFLNLSQTNGGTQLISYFWDFGDGNFSSAFEPNHTYYNSGTYNVRLTVTNECYCSSTYSMEIKIEETTLPITCPSVVCENTIQTYSVDNLPDNCTLEWQATGGTIVFTDSNFVRIKWDDIGPEGYGIVSVKNSCGCPNWTSVRIPVITTEGTIQGQVNLCAGQQYKYKLPQWPGTFFNWSVTDSNNNPTNQVSLINSDQINEVILDALSPGVYYIHCFYESEIAECGGTAKLKIVIKDPLEIDGPEIVCLNNSGTFTSPISYTEWIMYDNLNNIITTGIGNSFSPTFTSTGMFRISAYSADTCPESTTSEIFVEVPNIATISANIDGENRVCPDEQYTYSLPQLTSEYEYIWNVVGGTIIGSNNSDTVEIIFDQQVPAVGYYTISAYQKLISAPYCSSNIVTKQVFQKQSNVTISNSNNTNIFCPSSTTTFSFTSPEMNDIQDIVWSVENNLGGTNFGNIISGQGTTSVDISWNEISASNQGVVKLQIRFCGKIETISYNVTVLDRPSLIWTDNVTTICQGEAFNVQFTSNIPLNSGQIIWDFNDGTPITQNITGNNTVFTSPSFTYNNTIPGNVTRNISVTIVDANGCTNSVTINKDITVYPSPQITISPGYHYGICFSDPTYQPIVIFANTQGGISVNNISWFKTGNPSPVGTGSSLTINATLGYGSYYAIAYGANGCNKQSQNIIVSESCTPNPPCTLPYNPTITANLSSQSTCGNFQLTGTYNYSPLSVEWILPNNSGLSVVSSNDNNLSVNATQPGMYKIFYRLTYSGVGSQTCVFNIPVDVFVPYIADVRYEIECLGNGQYDITLWDNSTILLENGISFATMNYTFKLNGNTVYSGNNQSYNMTLNTSGNHTVTIELNHPNFPSMTCSASTTMTLFGVPDTQFTAIHVPSCVENKVEINLNSYTLPGHNYTFNFDNTSYVIDNSTNQVNQLFINLSENSLVTPITLVVTDPNGCQTTNTINTINPIYQAEFDGEITGGGSYCSDQNPVLTYQVISGPTPQGYQWIKDGVIIPGATASTYVPSQSGIYWILLNDANGCVYKDTPSANVNIIPPTVVRINGPETACLNTEYTLVGNASTSSSLESRWLVNGTPLTGWSTNTPTEITENPGVSGIFVYRYEVRDSISQLCNSFAEFTVEVIDTPIIYLNYSLLDCEPYTIKITANASFGTGQYLWSNGMNGDTIVVNDGGVFEVTFITSGGCSVTSTITAPKNPENYLWVFPYGCYEFCKKDLEIGINTPGPYPNFDYFEWTHNTNVDYDGYYTYSNPYTINDGGSYSLSLTTEQCTVTSPGMTMEYMKCDGCDLKYKISVKESKTSPYLHYLLSGIFDNNFNTSIVVDISSPTNQGVFVPSTFTLGIGGIYNFNPLIFIPNNNFNGNIIEIRFEIRDFKTGKLLCVEVIKVKIPEDILVSGYQTPGQDSPEDILSNFRTSINIIPNPAETITEIIYDLGNYTQGEIMIYDISGVLKHQQTVDSKSNSINYNTYQLTSGQYIVVLVVNGKVVNQHNLIKK